MIFFDVDTQRDFMEKSGALYVPGAEAIYSNIERLLRYAQAYKITVISSRCAHEIDDAEFEMFPPTALMERAERKEFFQTCRNYRVRKFLLTGKVMNLYHQGFTMK